MGGGKNLFGSASSLTDNSALRFGNFVGDFWSGDKNMLDQALDPAKT